MKENDEIELVKQHIATAHSHAHAAFNIIQNNKNDRYSLYINKKKLLEAEEKLWETWYNIKNM